MSSTLISARRRSGFIAAGALAAVLAATIAGPAGSVAAQSDDPVTDRQPATLSVDGTGRVKVTPDVADITLGVRIQKERAGAAAEAAAATMTKVVEALLAAGIPEEKIQTVALSLNPVYDYNGTPPKVVGYEAVNLVSVRIEDVAGVGAVVDAATEAGATSVDGISFGVADPTAFEAEARAAAVLAARAKADTLAGAAGVEIVGVLALSEAAGYMPQPVYYARAEMAMDTAGTPVLTGTMEIAVTVMVTYEIAG